MFSLAGIPPFPGFVAKFLIFKNVMAAEAPTCAKQRAPALGRAPLLSPAIPRLPGMIDASEWQADGLRCPGLLATLASTLLLRRKLRISPH